jgi:hypothetical protein
VSPVNEMWPRPPSCGRRSPARAIALTIATARSGARVAALSEETGSGDVDDSTEARRLRVAQWMVPAATGAMLAIDALMGEQQRPNQVMHGVIERLVPDRLRAA